MSKKRAAAFFYSETPREGYTPVPIAGGYTGYVRGFMPPPRTTLLGALDWAHRTNPGGKQPNYPDDSCFMNSHYAHKRKAQSAQVPVCTHCGSEDVRGDAYAIWDKATQQWEVAGGTVFDKGAVCERCVGETTLKWRKA